MSGGDGAFLLNSGLRSPNWGFVGSKGQEFGVQGLEISVHVLGMKA